MSQTSARQTRQITKNFTSMLTGRGERGPDRRVRRNSVDVGSRQAQVFRPIADGSLKGALGWIDCLLKVVSEWDDAERRQGGGRPLGLAGQRVLETILGRRGTIAIDFRSGRLEPAIDTIARVAKLARGTVIRALQRLKALKILDWVRRTEKTGNDGTFGPQRRQVSNAYFFTPENLPARVLQRLRDLLARKRLRTTVDAATPPAPPQQPAKGELGDILARMRAGIARRDDEANASPPSGQYPHSGAEG